MSLGGLVWVERLARRGALGTTPSRAGSHTEWLAQPLFRSLGSPERGLSSPTSKRALKATEEVRGHRVAEPSHCAVIGCIPITLFLAVSASSQGPSCRGWDGPSRLHREGAPRPAAPGFVKMGPWGSCSLFLSHANGVLLPCPPHSTDDGYGGSYPKPAADPAHQSPAGFPQRSQSKPLQRLLLMWKQDSGCDL